ncbi:NAD(P)-dependent malic enzyme [Nitrososphaera viennensis]|uniref:NADP-dependent malic enzyme n=1 Tax=Nitrososphaera viennensis TaxID=1034015 RepID=A0A977NMF7_9ARCH|nr:NADP-dependent malic enzyme [Nitrososphaera viennensis]UVS69351.1 NADP-dependent malic enzyme [Nitrososphaera viennensis]
MKEDAINLHRMLRGKIEIRNRVAVDNIFEEEKGTLGLIYTPGVAYVSKEIGGNKELAYEYTSKWNNVAIICDGTRVLGLGNVGPEAAIPVMEGKSVLFKSLADINAIPLCIATQDKQEIIRLVKAIQPGFGAVNIEDIESPKVLEIVEVLKNELDIPVFHDDQHGTAVITLAALVNALDLVGKKLDKIKVVIAGAGSAGYGIYRILEQAGCRDIIVADSKGAIYKERADIVSSSSSKNRYRQEIAERTNAGKIRGGIGDVINGADLFIGVSGRGNIISKEMVGTMNKDAIVFALSNPDPEILPPDALDAGARIAATGRSDFANQINNAVVFPSVLRALLDLRARYLDEDMLVAVAFAIASLVDRKHLTESFIIPRVNDPRILPVVTQTLRDAVMKHMDAKERQVLPQ